MFPNVFETAEAEGNLELFRENATQVMQTLVRDYLNSAISATAEICTGAR